MRGASTPRLRSVLVRISAACAAVAIILCPFALDAQQRAVPDIWGVWMGMGGVTDRLQSGAPQESAH